jgi:SurA N-terminal domain
LTRLARLRIPAVAVLVGVLSGCGGVEREAAPAPPVVPATPTADSVAVVGADRITTAELDAVIGESRRSWAAEDERYPEPGSTKFLDLRRQAIELLVERSRIDQAAAAEGVDVSASAVDEELDVTRRGQSEDFAVGRGDEQLRAEIREDLLLYEAYLRVAGGLRSDRRRNEAWSAWTQSMEARYAPTWFAPDFDPAELPRNIRRHPRPTNQRPYAECHLPDGSYDYGELVERGCAGDVYDPGPGDLLCPDLFLQERSGGFTSDDIESGYSEAQMYLADHEAECSYELGPHGMSIVIGAPRTPVPPLNE